MDKKFWNEKWKNKQIAFHEGKPNTFLLNHFRELKLKKGAQVFVPLCGKSMDVFWLLSEGYKVVAVELVESAVDELFHSLGMAPEVVQHENFKVLIGAGIKVYCGDFFELRSSDLGVVDYVYDRAALVAFPDDMRSRYASSLSEMTNKAPQFVITYTYDQSKVEGPPFSIDEQLLAQYYADLYDIQFKVSKSLENGMKGRTDAEELLWILSPKDLKL